MSAKPANFLAFDAACEPFSLALSAQGEIIDWPLVNANTNSKFTVPVNSPSTTYLLEAIFLLLEHARLSIKDVDAIVFGCGPGSFTGLRAVLSIAQGLALSANIRLMAVDSLSATALAAKQADPAFAVNGDFLVALDARMNEAYWARFTADFWEAPLSPRARSEIYLTPIEQIPLGLPCAGNFALPAATSNSVLMPASAQLITTNAARPTARAMLQLAPPLMAQGRFLLPSEIEKAALLYVRNKVAETTLERAAKGLLQA